MHAEVRSSRETTWYKWGFLPPFFPAWKDLSVKDHLCFYGTKCAWLFCRIIYEVNANRGVSSLRISVQAWATTFGTVIISLSKSGVFFRLTYKFLIAYLFYYLSICMPISQPAHYAIFFSIRSLNARQFNFKCMHRNIFIEGRKASEYYSCVESVAAITHCREVLGCCWIQFKEEFPELLIFRPINVWHLSLERMVTLHLPGVLQLKSLCNHCSQSR